MRLKKFSIIVTIGILMVTLPLLAFTGAADSAEVTPVSRILDGTARDVYVDGTTAYVSAGVGGLKIYDITNIASPVKIGEIDGIGYIESTVIDGDYAYSANGGEDELLVIDISDPANPELLDSYKNHGTNEYAHEVVYDNDIVYMANADGGLEVFNVADKNNIVFTDSWDSIGTAFTAVEFNGTYAFTAGRFGMKIANVADPYHVTGIIGFFDNGTNSDVEIVGNYAYLADLEQGLEIVNITDIYDMNEVGQYDLPFKSLNSITVSGSYAYVYSNDGFEIIDISDVTNPVRVGGIDNGEGLGIHIEGNYAFGCEYEKGVAVYDISTPATPVEVSRIDDEIAIEDIAVSGNTVFLAAGEEGVVSVDLTEPPIPVVDSTYVSAPVYKLDVEGNYVYGVSDDEMVVLSADTLSPIGTYTGDFIDVIVHGSLAYVFYNEGFDIVDISTPATPSSLGNYTHDTYGGMVTAFVDDMYVYAVDPDYGVYILDTSNPLDIVSIGVMETYFVDHLTVENGFAYLLSDDLGLTVFNVTDPEAPVEMGSYLDILNYPYGGFAFKDDVVYIGSLNGITLVDVIVPSNVTLFTQYEDDRATSIEVMGDYIVYTTGEGGLEVISVNVTRDAPPPDEKIPGYSTWIILATLLGVSTILALRKHKK